MSKTLATFLDRRKKSTVKAAALLLQTAEKAKEKTKALTRPEEVPSEHQSDHDDEWKVSDDESTSILRSQAATSGSLLLTVRTVTGDASEDRGMGHDSKPTQHVWQSVNEPLKKVEPPKEVVKKEETSKVWKPKFKSGNRGGPVSTKNDVDLAEAARILAAKDDVYSPKKTKKLKKKSGSPKPAENDGPGCYVKVKFNVFSLVPEKYHTFTAPHGSSSLDAEKVKAKYIARSVSTEAA